MAEATEKNVATVDARHIGCTIKTEYLPISMNIERVEDNVLHISPVMSCKHRWTAG